MAKNTRELRRNPISGTVVIIAPDREKSLEQLRRKSPRDWLTTINPGLISGEDCPFETGHEKMTPPEIRAYRKKGTDPDKPGWWIRVVPNLKPAVDPSIPSELLQENGQGPFFVTPAFGYHYLIIETTNHDDSLSTISKNQAREVLHMWRDLTLSVGSDRNIKYVFIFQNHGPLAGASQPHPHSQLIALPMIPTRIMNELRGARAYFEHDKECFYCNEIKWELRTGERLVETTENFIAWCPFASKTPYQIIIAPKDHQSYFANVSTHPSGEKQDFLTEFSGLFQKVLVRLRLTLDDPDYNLYFHTAPTNQPEMTTYHWHCQIEPITQAVIAGFEKGSGIYINPRSPESAAADLRKTNIK